MRTPPRTARTVLSAAVAASLALAALAALLAPAPAEAIPAFARKYRFSCTTCHAHFPRLKPYGEEYAGRGFGLEEGAEPARAAIDAGDPLLSLPRDFPLALRFDAHAQASEDTPELDLQAPWIFKVLTGGQVAEKIGFYAYFVLEKGEPGKIEDAYVQASDVFGLPVNVLAGQFQISDPIVKRELRLQRMDYEILRVRPGASVVDLTYDRGVALAGGAGPVSAVLMVTNGTGIEEADPTYDGDARKNVALHVAAELGPVRLGAFGLAGGARADGAINDTIYLGPQADVALGDRVQVSAAWLERRDSNASFAPGGAPELATRGGWGQVTWLPGGADGRLAGVALYQRVDSDQADLEVEAAAAAASWLFRRNVRLTAELAFDLLAERFGGSVGTVVAY